MNLFNKKKKGFTLVELLAVIVILAVIILIAVTAVIPRINSAKKNALVDEALMYLNAAKESYLFNGETDNISSCINITDLNEKYISKSSDSYSGVVITDYNNGVFTQTINLTDGKYYIVGSGTVTKNDVTDEEPSTFSSTCSSVPSAGAIGTNVTIDGSNSQVLKSIELSGNSFQNGTASVASPFEVEVVSGNKEITISGKNLFSGTKNQSITRDKRFDIPLSAGTYTISYDFISTTAESTPSYMQISYVLSDGTTVYNPVTITSGRSSRTFTLAKDATKFVIYANINYNSSIGVTTVIDNIQLEKGSSATTYEAYQSQTYPISLGDISLRKVSDHSDRIYYNNGKWYLDQNIRHLNLPISEIGDSETYPGWNNSDVKTDYPSQNIQLQLLTSILTNFGTTQKIAINTNGNGTVWLYANKNCEVCLTGTEWKQQYPNLVLTVDYVTPAPITTEITNQTLISQLNNLKNARCYQGQTNIKSNNLPFIINASCYK